MGDHEQFDAGHGASRPPAGGTAEGIGSTFRQVDFVKVAEGLASQGVQDHQTGRDKPKFMEDIIRSGEPTALDVIIDAEETLQYSPG
jgi:thiamine pyrophosphate-dependent acetolactate synthase large subunit-like protein